MGGGRQCDGRDDLAPIQRRLNLRRVPRKAIKLSNGDGARRVPGVDRLDLGVECTHRNGHVGRVDGDALIARAEYGVDPVESA